ncbi:hypothetical protein F3Y22_tig00111311pilonHSYRG00070 [Hibiscus syriacus]|uniref:Uncharacterized protein n=1 Tax=Hibiscus syriacus TaxID=106335 RepID=A0A6A2YR43_HIBSY|nr:hypothetical protein F3Y22_tig00111311pilonHSYRG00070 [Hibiscus syriacus]
MAEQGVLDGSQPVDLSKHPSGIVPTLQSALVLKVNNNLNWQQGRIEGRKMKSYSDIIFVLSVRQIIQKLGFPAKFKVLRQFLFSCANGAPQIACIDYRLTSLPLMVFCLLLFNLFCCDRHDFKIQNIVWYDCLVVCALFCVCIMPIQSLPFLCELLEFHMRALMGVKPKGWRSDLSNETTKIVLLIFVSVKIVITGAKVRDETYTTFENIYPVLTEFKKNQQW